jgi:hypothetical protein
VLALAVLAALAAGAPSDAAVGSVAETPGDQELATATDGRATALDRPAPAVDIVFVIDSSESMSDNHHRFRESAESVDAHLDGLDARYAVVGYNASAWTAQRLTADAGALERATNGTPAGGVERASLAVAAVPDLELRPRAQTVVVVVTDEDDDSSARQRRAARSLLAQTHAVVVSPATPAASNCARHSKPCDNRTENELRTLADSVDATWISAGTDRPGDRIGSAIAASVTPRATDAGVASALALLERLGLPWVGHSSGP